MTTRQVKVDNWGIYFLQRLKHFFNRTDYCDLTLQFQNNAQLKVHRLVLNACTEYFELLERTCEMYEDCLVMPDDLQADVVVPIVNFMYTGQLEFKQELLEKLYQTSLVMNMPVLTKLLYAHRQNMPNRPPAPMHSYSKNSKQDISKQKKMPVASSSGMGCKRNYNKAFEVDNGPKAKKAHTVISPRQESTRNGQSSFDSHKFPVFSERNKHFALEPRPTRYELPEELDEDNVFDNSFTSISYASKPLMVHPETVKQYGYKKTNLFEDASSSKSFFRGTSNDIVECRKVSMNTNLFDDGPESIPDEDDFFQQNPPNKEEVKSASQLFDQILENEGPKYTIESKDSNNIDHAKIISEVLKKYPHLMKSNKNIKLKILDTPGKAKKKVTPSFIKDEKCVKPKQEAPDFTYESDVIDSKEAAKLIALGAENVNGPWICLICGTPGRALHFTSYYKFRRHLVEIHNEKPISTICEYCGLKSLKRNYLLHHLYTKHGIEPPSNYNFPKCNYCNYIALTEAFLIKHKMTHTEYKGFRCNVCASMFGTSSQLLQHIQKTGHKYSADRKTNLQCIYCLKVFLREANLYTHLKTNHKQAAKTDGIIDDSEEEKYDNEEPVQNVDVKQKKNSESVNIVKYDMPRNLDNSYDSVQYQLEQKEDANIQIVSKRSRLNEPRTPSGKHKILNTSLELQNQATQSSSNSSPKKKVYQESNVERNDFLQDIEDSPPNNEEILLIDNIEYVIHNNQLIPKKERSNNDEYTITNTVTGDIEDAMPVLAAETLLEFQNIQTSQPQSSRVIVKKNTNINQPIQIVVSNEEEYKALMASNHSIIFDDGDPNKTLTVLTTQTGIPLETNTIDLETSQSNEMMIIPDNYPISVSETVSTDNSNIVVLYSHPIDDHNNQNLTNQGIEAQFVQSSAIITQNFETVTTCTPVMSAHVVNTSEEDTWQGNITENINKLPITSMETSIATVTPIESITSTNLNELPEIQLATVKDLPIEISQESLVTTSQDGSTVNVYSQSVAMQKSPTLVAEEISNHNILTSANQTDIVNSLNLLQQNVISNEIEPQSNVIIDNSSQIDISVLATVGTLCTTTDSNQNNENLITDNINISHTQGDDVSNTEEVHINKNHTTESIVHSEQITNNTISINNSKDNLAVKNLESVTIENQERPTEENLESQEVENQESLTVERQESQIVENQDSLAVEIQENVTVETPVNVAVNNQERLTVVHKISQTIENQDSSIPEQSNDKDSVTIDAAISIQHEPRIENTVPLNKKEIKITKSDNLENETESIETVNNDTEDIAVGTNIINNNIETGKVTDNNESNICNISRTTKPTVPNANYKANIENLTSEWSEDEIDSQPEETPESNIILHDAKTEPEFEESIENIQHEIDKHLASSKPELNTEREKRKSSDLNEVVSQNKIVPNENISALLNDWDDIDSQEEDVSTEQSPEEKNVSDNENGVKLDVAPEKIVNDSDNTNKDCSLKSDNIKSLVSDWDEEDEQEIKD